eukprot:g8777.t1
MAAAATPQTPGAVSKEPVWAGLLKQGIARHKNDPTAKYCQLGTAAIGGGASVRTWVFRGFYEDKGALKFITDRRSQKVPEIAADPAGEVCFYLKKTREQFRVRGRLQVVDVEESNEVLAKARRHQWTQISPASQASFATSLIPGLEAPVRGESLPTEGSDDSGPEKDGSEGGRGSGERKRSTRQRGGRAAAEAEGKGEPSKAPVSDDFCLVLLWPQVVDHLRLGDVQTRNIHKIKGDRDGGGAPLGGGDAPGAGGWVPEPITWVTAAVNP